MKVNKLYELLCVSLAMLSLATMGMVLLQQLSPDVYNEITGDVTSRTTLNVTPAPPVFCNFTLQPGFNLVSFFCAGDFNTISQVFGNIVNLDAAWGYDTSSASDPWKAYARNLPTGVVTDLTFVSRQQGYWINMSASEAYLLNGTSPSGVNIPITTGYQLLGYPNNQSDNISSATASINTSFSKMIGFDNVLKTYSTYNPGNGSSTLTILNIDRGYWLNGTTTDTWVIP